VYREGQKEVVAMKTIITIGREFGSGGHQIGKILADDLGIPYYDKELLERAAKDSGLCKEIFENQDEKPTSSFLYSLVMDSYSFGYSSNVMNDMPLNQKVFLAQFDSIKQLAKEGPCVIIGRCADYALEDNPNLLSVFIHADMDARVHRIANIYGLTANKASDRIRKNDKSRSSYYNYYTCKEWGNADSYDLCINSAKYGIDGTVELLKAAIAQKEKGYNTSIEEKKPANF
jgi:cytidylate kinase